MIVYKDIQILISCVKKWRKNLKVYVYDLIDNVSRKSLVN